MSKIRARDIFEGIGLVAIVLSLIFVGLQIQQDQVLARADLGSRGVETLINLKLHASDPEFAIAYAKMIDQPTELTDDEMIQLNNYLSAAKSLFVRECYLLERDVYEECDVMFRANATSFFGSHYAQVWWNRNWQSTPLTRDWMNDEIERLGPNSTSRILKEMRDEL